MTDAEHPPETRISALLNYTADYSHGSISPPE